MVTLSAVHYVFVIMTILILVCLIFKKEIVIPCVFGIFIVGLVYTRDLVASIQILNSSLIASNGELFSIMLVIAVVTAMSKAMHAVGIDELMIRPFRSVIRRPVGAFWGIGLCMLIVSWLLWPSPAVALIGALLLPVAGRVGLPAIWAAVAMNLFGHGMGLSSDFFIQGAPQITATASGLDVVSVIMASIPLWAVMSITTALVSYFMLRREMAGGKFEKTEAAAADYETVQIAKPGLARALTALILISFAAMLAAMIILHIVGGDATALVTGTALLLTCIIAIADAGLNEALGNVVDYLKEGFSFAIRIFAPVIVIAAFFFMGSESFASGILGEGAPAILDDISMYISARVPMNRVFCVLIEVCVGIITGLDGSGFSGLPIVGSVATTFASTMDLNTAALASLGQITTIWVGGGTVIPWGVIPVAAICGVSPIDLARKNLIPVAAGICAMSVAAVFLL